MRYPPPHLALLALLTLVLGVLPGPAAAVPPAGFQDPEIVREFRRYFRRYEDTATRVEAVLSLEGAEVPDVVDALLSVTRDDDPQVAAAAVRVLASFRTEAPVARLLVVLEETKDAATRSALLRAVEGGRYRGAQEVVLPLLEDRDWPVRREAVRALVALRTEGAPEAIAPLCEDREVAVRCAALDGLAELRSERVLAPARADLANPSWQVRASAVHALGRVRHRDSIAPLIERLAAEEGRLQVDVAAALAEITGREFGLSVDGWQRFWDTFGDRFQIPTDEELARLREKQAERRAAYTPTEGGVSYHGIDTPSRSILFVIDVSGSMEQEVIEKERFRDGDYPSYHRIDVVKTELSRTIQGLESFVRFNILAFATDVRTWKKDLVKANPLNRSSAETWISRLEAIGGSSKSDLAQAGLVGAANLGGGKTNTHSALMDALGAAGTRKGGREEYEVDVDTIFFLSDGRPSTGEYVDTDEILEEVRRANDLRKVVIHAIAIGEFEKDFMKRLALENGGVFVDLGR